MNIPKEAFGLDLISILTPIEGNDLDYTIAMMEHKETKKLFISL